MATVIPTAGAFIDAVACRYYWELARADLARHQLQGGQIRPELRSAQDALRSVALAYSQMSATSAVGHVSRSPADMAPESVSGGLVSTRVLADRLGVGSRHARRIASAAGIQAAARDAWHSADVDQLISKRRAS